MYATSREGIQPIVSRMSVTSEEVIASYNNFLKQIEQPETAASLQTIAEIQQKNEKQLLQSRSTSPFWDRLGGLKAPQLKEIAIRQFYNSAVMEAITQVVDSVVDSSVDLNQRLRFYFRDLHQVGPVIVADFKNAKAMFILETAQSPIEDVLLHQLIVTLYGTNKLRTKIPNFLYYFGYFKTSPPLIDPETQQVVTWGLHDDNPVHYGIAENIGSAITVSKYIETCSGVEFLNVFMQVLYALRLGLKEIDFTHYNLHAENVVLRLPHLKTAPVLTAEPANRRSDCAPIPPSCPSKIEPKPFQIAYETERGIEYITTTSIPTLVDFSHAHIRTNEPPLPVQHFGRNGLVPFSIFSYRSWIIHDLYKFLMYCLLAASRIENESVLKEATKIFRFFNHLEDPIVALEEQWPTRYAFPLTPETNQLTIDDLATYIRTVADCRFIQPIKSSLPTLDCESMCLSQTTALTRIGMNPKAPLGTPDNVMEFYEIAIQLQHAGRNSEKKTMARDFPYTRAMQNHITKMKLEVKQITELRHKLQLIDLESMTVDEVLQYKTMVQIRSMYMGIGAIIDKTVQLRDYRDTGVAVAKSFNNPNDAKQMEDLVINFDRDIGPSLADAKHVFGNNHAYLNRIQTDAIVQSSLQRDPRLKWYWEDRQLFDVVFGRVIIVTTE